MEVIIIFLKFIEKKIYFIFFFLGHTMVHGEEKDGTIGRISYTEFRHCGQ